MRRIAALTIAALFLLATAMPAMGNTGYEGQPGNQSSGGGQHGGGGSNGYEGQPGNQSHGK